MIDRDRFFVTHNQHIVGNNVDLAWDSQIFGLQNRFAAQLQTSRNWITFTEEGNPNLYPADSVTVVAPDPGLYGVVSPDIRNSRLDEVAASFEDRLKLTSALALIGGVRLEDLTLARNGINFDGTIPAGQPFTQTWRPVSYRAAYTYEPIGNLMFYSMFATAYDPAVAAIFSVTPAQTTLLTSSRIYETGAKQLFWDGKAEWTIAAYDILQRNVFVPVNTTTTDVAGEVASKGIEVAAAVRPIRRLEALGQRRLHPRALRRFRCVDRQHAAERGAGHRQCRRVLSVQSLALAGRAWRLGAPCRKPLSCTRRSHDAERLHDGGRLCVRRHSGPGSRASRTSTTCASPSACAT